MIEGLVIGAVVLWWLKEIGLAPKVDPPIFIHGMTPREYRRHCRQVARQKRRALAASEPPNHVKGWLCFLLLWVGMFLFYLLAISTGGIDVR